MSEKSKPETVTFLRKRKDLHALKEQTAKANSAKARAEKVLKEKFKHPVHLIRNSLKKKLEEKRLVRMKKVNLKPVNFGGVKTLLVIRTKLIPKCPSAITNTFNLLKLQELNTAVFLKSTPENLELLRTVQPYVEFGQPSLKSIKGLIYKRGATISSGRTKPLSSNIIVEEHLGAKGLICLEDLVHEISTSGPNFEVVTDFLAPFKFGTVKDKEVDVTHIISSIKDRTTPDQKSKAINQLISKLN